MTGHGQSHQQSESHVVDCEIRSVNNRYLKINFSGQDRFARFENNLQNLVREYIRRGTLYVSCKVHGLSGDVDFSINVHQLNAYRQQLEQAGYEVPPAQVPGLLSLPGVVDELASDEQLAGEIWPLVEKGLRQALLELVEMRSGEGRAMAAQLDKHLDQLNQSVQVVEARSPVVVKEYTTRLREKLEENLKRLEVNVKPEDIVREIGIFADRCDISEEVVRLQSHLQQFRDNLHSQQGDGRRMEFLTQEMLRESNTIGSKANDAEIAHQVVEMKTVIERIRELVQNIE